jgi:hypothetical protein
LTSALDAVSGQLHAPEALLQGKNVLGTHWIGGWIVPRVSLDVKEKRRNLAFDGNRDPAVRPYKPTEL